MTSRKMAVVAVLVLAPGIVVALYTFRTELYRPIKTRLAKIVEREILRDGKDISRARQRKALQETVEFVEREMPRVRMFADRRSLLRHGLTLVHEELDGLYCEFGVYEGESINIIASLVSQQVHGFDSFEGLPEAWQAGLPKGAFRLDRLPQVRTNVVLHKGWFRESLPLFKEEYRKPIAFMHLDADLYSSTKTVFDVLGERIVTGTVIQFDEFFNYPGWKEGEYRAFFEFVEARTVAFEYVGYVPTEEQVAVRITGVGPK